MEQSHNAYSSLEFIGARLKRSLQTHLVENDAVRAAFAELSFEIDLARQMGAPALAPELLEPTV